MPILSESLRVRMRAGHVRRWHIVAVAREQTISDHMHRVEMIVDAIMTDSGFTCADSVMLNALFLARYHDMDEVLWGDLPSPTKRMHVEAGGHPVKLGHLLSEYAPTVDRRVKEVEDALLTSYPWAVDLVKYADLLEAIDYLGHFGLGPHAKDVSMEMIKRANEYLQKLRETPLSFPALETAYVEMVKNYG